MLRSFLLWQQLGIEVVETAMAAGMTITSRNMMIANAWSTGALPWSEMWRMTSEKQLAAVEIGTELVRAAVDGRTDPDALARFSSNVLRPWHRRTRANVKRLVR